MPEKWRLTLPWVARASAWRCELVADGDGEGAGVELLHAEAHGGFVEELVGDGPGALGRAVFGGEDVGVAEGFLDVAGDGCAVVAGGCSAEPVVHAVAPDGVEEVMHAVAVEGEELLHGGDALGVEAHFGAGADAGEVAEVEVRDGAGELRWEESDEAVGLLHVAGDLGEVAVGRHADGAAQGYADVAVDGLLDGEGDLAGAGRFALAAHELADHLIDGGVVGDGAGQLDGVADSFGVLGVVGVVAGDEDDLGADFFCFADLRAGLDTEGFGLIAGGDATGGVCHGGDYGEGLASIFGVELLLDRCEEAVEVDVEVGEEVGLGVGGHEARLDRIIFALCLPEEKLGRGLIESLSYGACEEC